MIAGIFMKAIIPWILVILLTASSSTALQVAVIGTTGNLARETIRQLSENNVSTRALLRHDISNVPVQEKLSSQMSSVEVAAYLASLPNVKMVKGDITDPKSIQDLVAGCDAILSLNGPPKPNPISSLIPFLDDQNSKTHPYMINYIGTQNIIDAAKATPSVNRIVRITGKGEQPFSIFSILINMLGCLAKGWNYEGEELLRKSGVDYTIVRPGILKTKDDYEEKVNARSLADNGQDMAVSSVTYSQIAEVCIECLDYDNTKKSTLTVMNVDENHGEARYSGALLEGVKPDTREFPESLIDLHRQGARLGALGLSVFAGLFLKSAATFIGFLLSLV